MKWPQDKFSQGVFSRLYGTLTRLRGILFSCLVLLPACAPKQVEHQKVIPFPVPEKWSVDSSAAVEVEEQWWQRYLRKKGEDWLREAFQNNQDIRETAARVLEAQAIAKATGAALFPSVSAQVTGNRQRREFVGLPIPGGEREVLQTTTNSYGVSFDLAWELDLWGKLRAERRASQRDLVSAAYVLDAARLSLIGQFIKLLATNKEAETRYQLLSREKDLLCLLALRAADEYQLGALDKVQFRAREVACEAAREKVYQAERACDGIARQFEVLLGRYPKGDETPQLLRPDRSVIEVPAGVPARVLARRVDVRAAQQALLAAQDRVYAAQVDLLPSFSLTASTGKLTQEFDQLLEGSLSAWAIAGRALAPLFEGGRRLAAIDLAKAREEGQEAAYVATVLGAFYEVEKGLRAEELLRLQLQAVEKRFEAQKSIYERDREQFRLGLLESPALVQSESMFLSVHIELASVKREWLENRVDLHLALGGSFSPPKKNEEGRGDEKK